MFDKFYLFFIFLGALERCVRRVLCHQFRGFLTCMCVLVVLHFFFVVSLSNLTALYILHSDRDAHLPFIFILLFALALALALALTPPPPSFSPPTSPSPTVDSPPVT